MKEVRLYNADTLEYAGTMIVKDNSWDSVDINDKYLLEMTKGMPIKSVLPCLITFNLVYDIIEEWKINMPDQDNFDLNFDDDFIADQ